MFNRTLITVNKSILKNLVRVYCVCILTVRKVVILVRRDLSYWENTEMYFQCKNTDFVSVKFTFVTTEVYLVYSSSGKIIGRLRYLDRLIIGSLKFSFWKI